MRSMYCRSIYVEHTLATFQYFGNTQVSIIKRMRPFYFTEEFHKINEYVLNYCQSINIIE